MKCGGCQRRKEKLKRVAGRLRYVWEELRQRRIARKEREKAAYLKSRGY
jgi:hypothetical protein